MNHSILFSFGLFVLPWLYSYYLAVFNPASQNVLLYGTVKLKVQFIYLECKANLFLSSKFYYFPSNNHIKPSKFVC